MPLALVEAAPSSTPLDKGKRVVKVVSNDEDSAEGQVFKRQRTQHAPQTVTSATSSSHGVESLREDPPSATSPPQPMDLEGGVETEPTGVPPPAPELPLPMQDSLRGFLGRASPGSQAEGPQRESLYYYSGCPSFRLPSAGEATENATLQTKVQELMAALASKDQEMTAQAANFKIAEEKLVEEFASSFAEGFAEALVQAACVNSGIDVTGCSPLNEVVDGKLVPLEGPDE